MIQRMYLLSNGAVEEANDSNVIDPATKWPNLGFDKFCLPETNKPWRCGCWIVLQLPVTEMGKWHYGGGQINMQYILTLDKQLLVLQRSKLAYAANSTPSTTIQTQNYTFYSAWKYFHVAPGETVISVGRYLRALPLQRRFISRANLITTVHAFMSTQRYSLLHPMPCYAMLCQADPIFISSPPFLPKTWQHSVHIVSR